MAAKVHRVVVRGQFDGLTPDQRTALLAELEDHDIFKAAYTAWGSFTYDAQLVSFSFRYEVRTDDDDDAEEALDPADVGIALTRETMDGWGLAMKHVRANATDMSELWKG